MKRIAFGLIAVLIATSAHADDKVRLYWRDVRDTMNWQGKVSLPKTPATAVERGPHNVLWDPMELIMTFQSSYGGWFSPDGVRSWVSLGEGTLEQCRYQNRRRVNKEMRVLAVCPSCDEDDVAAVCQRPL